MFKITIEKITKTEHPETNWQYEKDKEGEYILDNDGEKKGAYFKTGEMLIKTEEEEIYTQVTENIDIKHVIDAFNLI